MNCQQRLMIALVALMILIIPTLAACGTKVTVEPNSGISGRAHTLTSSGEGRVTISPDFAVLTLGVSVLRNTVTDARSAAAIAIQAVLTELRSQGVDDEDIVTTQFSIHPEYDFRPDGKRDLLGFRVINQISAKVREMDRVGEAIDGAVNAAGDDAVVTGISFSIDDNQSLVNEARRLAVRDAQRKAGQLADLTGVKLGSILEIWEEGSVPSATAFIDEAADAFTMRAETRSPIEGGQILVSLRIFVTYAIE